MSNSTPEMGQGEKTLTRAAGMVADAKSDFDGFSRKLDGQIAGLQGQVGRRRRHRLLRAARGLDREAERHHERPQRVRGLADVHRAGQHQHRRGPVGELQPDRRSPRRLTDQD